MVALALGGARERLPARGRAARRPVARHAQRRDDARAVEDRPPGGDRRGLRARRLPALQRRVHDADLRRAAALVAGRLEPARVPAARGVRLRRLALQLHGHRRQPAELGGADGQRRRLEAGLDRDAERLLPHAPLPGRRAARRGDQPRLRLGRDDRRRGARAARPRRHPLHRLDRRLQRDVEDASAPTSAATATTRGSSARPAARTSSSPTPRPTSTRSRRRSSAARSSTRARSARPPRASTPPRTSGRRCASGWPRRWRRSRSATSADFGNFMGAVIDASLVRDATRGDRGGPRARRRRRSWSAAVSTTRSATSSSRP